MTRALSIAGFDVVFDVDVSPHRITIHHTNLGLGGQRTVPVDMGHDGMSRWTRDYETAALPLN